MRRVSSVKLVTPCIRSRVMTRLARADQVWGPFPVLMRDRKGDVAADVITTAQPEDLEMA